MAKKPRSQRLGINIQGDGGGGSVDVGPSPRGVVGGGVHFAEIPPPLMSPKKKGNVVLPTEGRGHKWEEKVFDQKPVWCDYCDQFVWDHAMAVGCAVCHYSVHAECVQHGMD